MGQSSSHHRPPIIAHCSAPSYCVKLLGSRHLLLGGGGGAAKTGVVNQIETHLLSFNSLSLDRSAISSDAKSTGLRTYLTATIDTSPHATMNMDVIAVASQDQGRHLIAAGHDEASTGFLSQGETESASDLRVKTMKIVNFQFCVIYETTGFALPDDVDKLDEKGDSPALLTFNFRKVARFATDFSSKKPYQKVVRFDRSTGGRRLFTAGGDGYIRIWDLKAIHGNNTATEMKPVSELKAHGGAIDDMDIASDGNLMITVGYDREDQVAFWDLHNNKRIMVLPAPEELPANVYRVRSARFTILGINNVIVVVAYNQIQRTSKSNAMLTLWAFNAERVQCKLILCKEACAKDGISTLAVSACGNFTGIGTLGGSIGIYDTHEMRRLYFANASHSIFVTGLEFLPQVALDAPIANGTTSGDSKTASKRAFLPGIASEYRSAMVSLSADQTIQIHTVPYPSSSSITGYLLKLSIFSALLYLLIWYLVSL